MTGRRGTYVAWGLCTLLALGGTGRALGAQRGLVARGDSLLRAGNAAAAEAYFYEAARRRPRDPAARLALGRYLAARGALKVGAVLMEEARFFGGDPQEVALALAPVYTRLGDFRALASLPSSPLGATEKARADWLRANPPAAGGDDSTTVAYAPSDTGALGRVTITVGGQQVEAEIDPTAQGLAVDPSLGGALRTFGGEGAAVATSVRVGGLTLANVPVRVEALAGARARLGLDLLADLTPTFDAGARRLTLRRAKTPRRVAGGERVQTLFLPTGLYLIRGGRVRAFAARDLRPATRWTLDGRRGELVVGR
jgi:hypothetical protein